MIHRKLFWIGLTLALCCLLLLVAFSTSPHGQVTAASAQTVTNIAPSSSGPGLPAIHPSLQTASASTAQFTIADVQVYLQTHPFVGGPTVNGATASIATIQFMTSKQASVLMQGEETGLSATATVCYVKLNGPFTLVVPAPPGAAQLPQVAYGVEIFDAQTGNILMWWTP